MTLIYVITASFIIKEVDPLFLVCLSHTIPFHANGLCIVYVYAFVLAPSSEGGHLLAGNIAEVSEVAPHVDAEQVIKALQQCLLAEAGQIIVCLRTLVFGGRNANGHGILCRLFGHIIARALCGQSAYDSILIA